MRVHVATLLLALLAGSPAVIAQPAQPPKEKQPQKREVDLRSKLVPGKETKYELTIHAVNTLAGKAIEPGDGDQDMRQQIGLRVLVERVDDAGSTLKVQYESLKVRLRSPIADVDFDSAAPDRKPAPGGTLAPIADILAGALKRAAGTTLTVQMDASGAITSVTGGETLDLGTSIGIPGLALPGGGAGGQGLEWLAGAGREGAGVRRVGERWTTSDKLANTPVGEFTMFTVYDLRSASAAEAHVDFRGQIEASSTAPSTTAPAAPGAPGMGAQIGPSAYEGEYEWDLRLGELAKMTSRMRVSMVTPTTNGAEGVTMSSDTDMKVERVQGQRRRPVK